MAMLAHALQLIGAFIAPLIIFFLKPESRFVRFHALQALLLQLLILFMWIIGFVLMFVFIFASVAHGGSRGHSPEAAFMIPLFWLGGLLFWVVDLVLAIVYAIKAGQGEWAGYPILGGIARRILGL